MRLLILSTFLLISSMANATLDLSVVTFNTGFLDRTVLWQRIFVPDYEARLQYFESEIAKEIANNGNPSIVALQELWNEDAFNEVTRVFLSLGYKPISPSVADKSINYTNHGLEIFVKEDQFEITEADFKNIYRNDAEKLLEYNRGFLFAKLNHKVSNQSVFITTAHFTPLVIATDVRAKQVQDSIQFLTSRTEDLIILAGDLNFSPEFKFSIPERRQEGTDFEWQSNAGLYYELVGRSALIDSYSVANHDAGFTQNRIHNDLANFSDSTKNEPDQRIDYILYKSQDALSCKTLTSKLIFTQPVTDEVGSILTSPEGENSRLFLSDHFGVRSHIQCFN